MTRIPTPLCALAFAVLAAVSPARGEIIYIRDLELQGKAAVTASAWDIGHKDALFNRNWGDIYRTAAINPAVITVSFNDPVTAGAARMLVIASPHNVTLEAADTVADLDAKSGSYTLIFQNHRVEDGVIGWREWNETPVTGRVFRFTVERLERDDFVHIRELELQTPEPVETILIDGVPTRLNVIEVQPDDPEVAVGSSITLTAEASLSYGPDRYDVTDLVSWTVTPEGAADVFAPGRLTGLSPADATIHTGVGAVQTETPLTVRPRRPVDLNVGFIDQSPDYERFHVDFNGDQTIQAGFETQKKWPDPGELVTYTGHVRNHGDDPAVSVPYEWRFDGQVVASGTIPLLLPGVPATVQHQAPWPADVVQTLDIDPGAHTFDPIQLQRAVGDHTIELVLDPDDVIAELSEANNAVCDFINAMKFHFYMEEHTYRKFSRRAGYLETFSPEDWAQAQVDALERKFWASGAYQHLRLDTLTVVPDGTLDPGGTHEPIGNVTWTTDGVWGFDWPADYMDMHVKRVDAALTHELGHQMGLIDVYQYDIATDRCHITHDGVRVAGTALMPSVSPWNVYYGGFDILNDGGVAVIDDTARGVMASPGAQFVGPGTAAGINRNIGLRRGFFGDYLGMIPQGEIGLAVTHIDGQPLSGASIRVFQREVTSDVPDNPKFAGTLGADGRWVFPDHALPGWKGGPAVANPWSDVINGVTYNAPIATGGNAVLVVELEWSEQGQDLVEYHFVECDRLNVAFAAGQTGDYDIRLRTHASRSANSLPSIQFSTPASVTLTEGGVLEVTVSANDPDGDPVSISHTPIVNSSFSPVTGVFRFEPDSLQVTRHNGVNQEHVVTFIADDGSFRSIRYLRITVDDDPAYGAINDIAKAPPCPVDLTGDGVLDFFDVARFLTLYNAGDLAADFDGSGALDFFDVALFLTLFGQGCDA